LKAPTTFAELTAAAKTIQAAGKVKFPVALPLLASSDISTQYMNGLLSQGVAYTDAAGKTAALTTPQSEAALTALKNLAPFMDPQVTTFDQPKVQQQMYNGTAAIAIMYSGRMADLINAKNSKFSADFGFAEPPAIKAGGKPWGVVSVDGWSIPKNMKLDRDLLFQIMAASISAEAGASSLPAAYPSRKGLVTPDKVPYASAVQSTLADGATTPPPFPWVSDLQAATRPFVAQVITGELSPKDAMSKMQTAATAVLAKVAG